MTDSDPITPDERHLWQLATGDRPPPGECPDELALAACNRFEALYSDDF